MVEIVLANPPMRQPKIITRETREDETEEGEQSFKSENEPVTEL